MFSYTFIAVVLGVAAMQVSTAPIARRQDATSQFDLSGQSAACNASLVTFATAVSAANGTIQALVASNNTRTAATASQASSDLGAAPHTLQDGIAPGDSEQNIDILQDLDSSLGGISDDLNGIRGDDDLVNKALDAMDQVQAAAGDAQSKCPA